MGDVPRSAALARASSHLSATFGHSQHGSSHHRSTHRIHGWFVRQPRAADASAGGAAASLRRPRRCRSDQRPASGDEQDVREAPGGALPSLSRGSPRRTHVRGSLCPKAAVNGSFGRGKRLAAKGGLSAALPAFVLVPVADSDPAKVAREIGRLAVQSHGTGRSCLRKLQLCYIGSVGPAVTRGPDRDRADREEVLRQSPAHSRRHTIESRLHVGSKSSSTSGPARPPGPRPPSPPCGRRRLPQLHARLQVGETRRSVLSCRTTVFRRCGRLGRN